MSKNSSKYDSSQTHLFTSFPDSQADSDTDMTELLTNEMVPDNSGNLDQQESTQETTQVKYSVWQLEYYQKYFDVDTNEVMLKVTGSLTPTFNQNYFLNRIRPNPDLYGPFWITMSLVFSIAISGNFVSFMQNFGSDFKWHTDFHKVTSSAAVIITYWWLVPTGLYALQRWRQNQEMETTFSYIELLSIYGYSLFVYIPCSILWMINIGFVQWILVIVAVGLSGTVLFFTFWPSFRQDSKHLGMAVMFLIILLNALLGLSFMLYFFHDPSSGVGPNHNTTLPSIATTLPTTLPTITSSFATSMKTTLAV